MENEVKEEVKVETKKKGNGLFTLFACIMTGVIVFLATNIGQKASKVVDPDTNSGSKESNVTSNVESNTTSNIESNVTSNVTSNVVSNTTSNVTSNTQNNEEAIKTAVYNKMKILFPGSVGKNLAVRNSEYTSNLFDNKLTEGDKVNFAINATDEKDLVKYTPAQAKKGKFSSNSAAEEVRQDITETLDVVTASAMAKQYKALFGTEPKYTDGSMDCPMYYYDSLNKVYVPIVRCGGAGGSSILLYIDSYKIDGNTVVVSTYAGLVTYAPDQNDVIYDRPSSDGVKVKEVPENSKFEIDSTNYGKFAHYMIYFEKAADGQYYFKSLNYNQA